MAKTFTKAERLTSKKLIESVFTSKQNCLEFPFRASWVFVEPNNTFPAQVLISVSKKKIKKATQRNLLKRRIREAYRKNKDILYGPLKNYGKQMAFCIVYIADKTETYQIIEHKIILTLQRIAERVNEEGNK